MSNNDNAMTRFLFAILRQKNLKDIDWNKVARDPILAQEITNGHAARMRYSRFRSAMLGLEPQRRNRTNLNKSKVTKSSKKDTKSKKDDNVKPEPTGEAASMPGPPEAPTGTKIKQETPHPGYDSRLTPGPSMPPVPPGSSPHVIQPRLLTPCSDTDGFVPSQTIMSSPAGDMMQSPNSLDFPPAPHYGHDHHAWPQPSMYSFSTPSFGFDGFPMPCDHQPIFHPNNFTLDPQPGDVEGEYINVKHEEWDDRG